MAILFIIPGIFQTESRESEGFGSATLQNKVKNYKKTVEDHLLQKKTGLLVESHFLCKGRF